MALNTKESLDRMKFAVTEGILGLMANSTRESGLITRCTVMENLFGETEKNMSEIS